jgi:hypothetical protein
MNGDRVLTWLDAEGEDGKSFSRLILLSTWIVAALTGIILALVWLAGTVSLWLVLVPLAYAAYRWVRWTLS